MSEVDSNIYAALMQRQNQQQDSLRFQLDPTQELEDFKNNMVGLVLDPDTGEYKKDKNKKPLINEEGANMIMTFAAPRLSKLSSLSNLDSEQINTRAKLFEEDMEWALARHMHEFDIPSFPVMSLAASTVGDLNLMTSMRAIGGWEGDGIRKQHSVVESKEVISDNRQENNKAFIPPWFGNKRR